MNTKAYIDTDVWYVFPAICIFFSPFDPIDMIVFEWLCFSVCIDFRTAPKGRE